MKLITSHLAGIARFSGRESRQSFWFYAACVFGLCTIGSFAAVVPIMVSTFSKIHAFASEHPDLVTETYGPGSYHAEVHGQIPGLAPDFSAMILVFAAIAFVAVLLLAAATVRRLHDCDRTGAWGLLPLPFLMAGFILMPILFGDASAGSEPSMGVFLLLFFNNLIYLAALGVLIVLLARPGTPDGNRFGPVP